MSTGHPPACFQAWLGEIPLTQLSTVVRTEGCCIIKPILLCVLQLSNRETSLNSLWNALGCSAASSPFRHCWWCGLFLSRYDDLQCHLLDGFKINSDKKEPQSALKHPPPLLHLELAVLGRKRLRNLSHYHTSTISQSFKVTLPRSQSLALRLICNHDN